MVNDNWISNDRLKPYLDSVANSGDDARVLYVLDRELGASLFQDISFIEVALRNAMNRYLTSEYGDDWYCQIGIGFDGRVLGNIADAWNSLPSKFTKETPVRNQKLGGRLVAASMFRTWTNMLDKGGSSGLPAPFDKSDHDKIWDRKALLAVFPGALTVAKAKDENYEHQGLTREWVYKKVLTVRQIRNRIAHHESVAPKGIPITGTEDRIDRRECFEACLDLAGMLDRDLQTFIRGLNTPTVLKKVDDFLAGDNKVSSLPQQEGAIEDFDNSSKGAGADEMTLGKQIEKRAQGRYFNAATFRANDEQISLLRFAADKSGKSLQRYMEGILMAETELNFGQEFDRQQR